MTNQLYAYPSGAADHESAVISCPLPPIEECPREIELWEVMPM